MLLDKVVRYVLWFAFAVVFGSFVFGLIKFWFNVPVYIEYLNNIQISQLLSWKADTTTWSLSSWNIVDLTGDDLNDTDMQSDAFDTTWLDTIISEVSGAMDDESYGFVKNLENTWSKSDASSQAHVVASGSVDILTWDAKEQLKNLLLREE